jgi:hypothetical protein
MVVPEPVNPDETLEIINQRAIFRVVRVRLGGVDPGGLGE